MISTLVGCGTLGVRPEGRAWAEVMPTIAHELMLDSRTVVIFDVRPAEEFAGPLGHIDRAVSIPLGLLSERLQEFLPYRNTTVIVYGDAQNETVEAVETLADAGFRNLVLIRGGIRHWIERGYKTVGAS